MELTPGKACPLCGKYYGKAHALQAAEFVDSYKLFELVKPYIRFSKRGSNTKTYFRDTPVHSSDPDLQILYRLKNGVYHKSMKAPIAERILIRFGLDPRVDEILFQD